jgi:hypothetical protein
MNDRIQQLARQADLYAFVSDESIDPDIEKFARLIVRECMTICKEHPSRIVSNNWVADAVAPDIVSQFEEHFGVEE